MEERDQCRWEEWEQNRRKAVVGREEERDKCKGKSGNTIGGRLW